MGLCKCPKKKVTNQFCFEHRVNVCESCMVTNHPKCVIQSYLLWLQDSDYNPSCTLCSNELNNDECIRLLCFHVFHWKCLDSYAKSLPPNTAPAGYTCPTCEGPIFPASNVVSPVADHVRDMLSRVNWAREGLGLPLMSAIESSTFEKSSEEKLSTSNPDRFKNGSISSDSSPNVKASPSTPAVSPNYPPRKPESVITVGDSSEYGPQSRSDKFMSLNAGSSPRKLFDTTSENTFTSSSLDHDENKYKRRSASEWLARWFKSRLNAGKGRQSSHLYKRYAILAVILFLILVTVIMIFSHVGRMSAEHDPMLDPKRNPVIRVQGDD